MSTTSFTIAVCRPERNFTGGSGMAAFIGAVAFEGAASRIMRPGTDGSDLNVSSRPAGCATQTIVEPIGQGVGGSLRCLGDRSILVVTHGKPVVEFLADLIRP